MNARPAVNAKRNSQGGQGMFKVLNAWISQSGWFRGKGGYQSSEQVILGTEAGG